MTPLLTGVFASQISGHLTPAFSPTGSYDALAVYTVPSGGTTTINFNLAGITGYKHLQIRGLWKPATTSQWAYMNFGNNGTIDTAANYSYHNLYGNGSSAVAENVYGSSGTSSQLAYNNSTTYFSPFICDILDYADTNKYKTTKCLWGLDKNTSSGYAGILSTNWRSTNAITDIQIKVDTANNISEFSQFAIYGIKG